jgi:hypothetical protein
MYNQIQENDRHCLECGLMLLGRSDKKFCGDQCRASFHNREYSDKSKTVRSINRVLKKNRLLLKTAADQGLDKISRKNLEEMGFNFKFYTHSKKSEDGSRMFFCYETGYQENSRENLKLIPYQPI